MSPVSLVATEVRLVRFMWTSRRFSWKSLTGSGFLPSLDAYRVPDSGSVAAVRPKCRTAWCGLHRILLCIWVLSAYVTPWFPEKWTDTTERALASDEPTLHSMNSVKLVWLRSRCSRFLFFLINRVRYLMTLAFSLL